MPAEGAREIPRGVEMLGDERGVVVGGASAHDRVCEALMQPGTIGAQLGFVSHRANKRMSECEDGTGSKRHLVDEFES